jgi:hypothetical protein
MTKEIDIESAFDGTDDFSDVPERPVKKAHRRKEPLFTNFRMPGPSLLPTQNTLRRIPRRSIC